jgi:DNA polymerase-3 subunit epsilon
MYVIVDIETTGGNKNTGRITEIAAIKHNGHKVVDTFETLVNPEVPIPQFIQKLTRITDEMVANAPTFDEVADEFDAFTSNSIFIAHNVNFDYRFIREEFRKIGKDFSRKKMCTVQLSRKAFPGLPSYSLGKITKELSIPLDGHHRASVDARATTLLFEKIVAKESQQDLFDLNFGKPNFSLINSPLIDSDLIDSIPDESGVFQFYNQEDELIYVKRSQHILTDVCKKLTEVDSQSGRELVNELHRIDWVVLGSDLLSQLDEADAVVKQKPKFNSGKFSIKPRFGGYLSFEGEELKLTLEKFNRRKKAEILFTTFHEGLEYFKQATEGGMLELEFYKNGKHRTPTIRIEERKEFVSVFSESEFYLFDEGRTANESAFIHVRGTHILGYGFVEDNHADRLPGDEWLVKTFMPTPELELVVRSYMAKGRFQKMIEVD